jgi:hypothetical protein
MYLDCYHLYYNFIIIYICSQKIHTYHGIINTRNVFCNNLYFRLLVLKISIFNTNELYCGGLLSMKRKTFGILIMLLAVVILVVGWNITS